MHELVKVWWWFQEVMGINIGIPDHTPRWYNFFSGFGSDLAELAILGGLVNFFHHHNCAVKRCPRLGKHEVYGTPYKTCHRHATEDIHKALHKQHKWEYPSQHKLLNKDNYGNSNKSIT